ncbi:baculoviral IAP repeat-containing protein 7-like [Styela clava]
MVVYSISNTDVDGRTYAGHRDPPGQSSFYITPGDQWKENYRVSTFSRFPEHYPVSPTRLAASGFYYTGFVDRVKCFSCGLCVENWSVGDDPQDKKWHKTDCDFANGRPTNNQPLLGAFTNFLKRSPPRNRCQPNYNEATGSSLFNNARNALNISQIEQNEPAETTHTPTNANDISHTAHATSLSPLPSLITSQRTSLPSSPPNATNHVQARLPVAQETSSIPANATQETRNELYPCRAPVNPHMESVINRLESFKPRPGCRWPSDKLRATIDELVNAGFFYLGERDRVKCWYCNGGLQNWEYEDSPIVEHAKWFPSCEYVLRIKGPTFVENIVAEFPDIDRPAPIIRTMPRAAVAGQPPTPPLPMDIPPSPLPQPQPSIQSRTPSPPAVENPPPVLSTSEAVEQGFLGLEYVKQAREMGFDVEAIKTVLKRKYETNGQFYNTGEEFMEALFGSTLDNRNQTQVSQPNTLPQTSTTVRRTSSSSRSHSPPSEENQGSSNTVSELRRLELDRNCKVCRSRPSNIVFIPCGHLASCDQCITDLRKCPLCARTIQDTIKTFRA